MRTILATICALLLGLTFADSSSATAPLQPSMTATLLGQTGEDIVGTFTQAPDGIKDVHVRLTGVSSPLSSVKITGANAADKWQTPNRANWWLVAIKPQTDPSIVDLYFDPRTPAAAYTITLNFDGGNQTLLTVTPPLPPPVAMWILQLSTFGSGTGTMIGAGVYPDGTLVTLLATPAAGSTFSGWLGDGTCPTGSITMTANVSCIAVFTLIVSSPAPTPIPAPAPSPTTSLPEGPRVYVDTTYVPPTGNVITVQGGGNLQGAINAATLGDVIELQAGATYPGKIMLPNKTSGAGWVIIRSSAWQSLPPAGTRVGPQHAPLMAKITTSPADTSNYAIQTQPGAHHYRFIGIEVTGPDPAPGNQQYGLVSLDGSYYDAGGVYHLQPTDALTPHHIVIDRSYLHGTTTGEFMRAVVMHGIHVGIVDSYLSNFHCAGSDSQAVVAWNTPGPLKLVNNYLEGAGENVMFGGAASAAASYMPSDIEIRHNFFDKPLTWRLGDPAYAGRTWSVKNLLEFKAGQRAIVEGNVFGHHWAGSQSGFFFLVTPRGETNQNPWTFTGDIAFRYNKILATTAGMALSGTDTQVTQNSNRVLVEHNIFENIGAYIVTGAYNGEFLMPTNAIQNLTIRHNTAFNSYTPLHFVGDSVGPMNGLTIVDNIFGNGGYGIAGDGNAGVAELNQIAPGWVMRKNAIYGPFPNALGVPQSYYPADDYFPASQGALGFVNLAGKDYHLATTSSYKNAGSDGTDVGADIDAVNAATACVMSGVACGTP